MFIPLKAKCSSLYEPNVHSSKGQMFIPLKAINLHSSKSHKKEQVRKRGLPPLFEFSHSYLFAS